jgi:succinate dehydrogenase/fumarate reductase flavoprotein subunit
MTMFDETYDVVVVGGGNAGFSAATTAAQLGSRVLLVEKAPQADAGGNTFFTAGAYRTCFGGLDDLLSIIYKEDGTKGLPRELVEKIDMKPYTPVDFHADIKRVCKGRTDPALANVLVDGSRDAVQWIADLGGKWRLSFNRQAFEVDGRFKFWGGMVMAFLGEDFPGVCWLMTYYFTGGGKELFNWHTKVAQEHGVTIYWSSPATSLCQDPQTGCIKGVEMIRGGRRLRIGARGGVVLATGGFSANPALRVKYLGPGWDLAHVRGSKYNAGDGHRMASQVGAKLAGNYSGCHSVAWDANSPADAGDRVLTNQYTKSGYPMGIMVNVNGDRFVDEGFDLRNFTYAVFGKEILKQPLGTAFQIWDSDGAKWLRKEEYADNVTVNIRANTLEGLADKLANRGLKSKEHFLHTVADFNQTVTHFKAENPDKRFDPATKDGVSTQSSRMSLPLAKSNWALPIEKGPFTAVEVTTGITFTFGGLAIDPQTANVISEATREPIEGLYCTGELLGGLFWDNYPGGSGLTMGTVLGRIAGSQAAKTGQTVADAGIAQDAALAPTGSAPVRSYL